jgi:hypothetical protein
MEAGLRLSRRFLWLRLLRVSLVAGALYDLSFALLMLAAPEVASRAFGLPLPGAPFYMTFMATVLAMLGLLYLLAARDPRRYSGVIAVAVVGRLLGAAGFAFHAATAPELAGLWPLAAGDAAFGLGHGAFWAAYGRPSHG